MDESNVTSKQPSAQWVSAFADDQTLTAAMLDWLLHHAHVVQITGDNDRMKGKRRDGQVTRSAATAATA